ncbi:MAG TPA: glycine cleavage system protein GcvH [Thermomicrobiales bacterium]|nr:glycine cleavage system protein GcvH [Thermomicrobiales bacterium]
MEIPRDYRFTKTHEWVRVDGDVATIGITDFAQSELGDITYLELPGVGASVSQSEPFGVVESVKAASDIYAPVTGEVVEENSAAIDSPEVVNSSPYGDAWLLRIRLADTSQLDGLLDADAYSKLVAESGGH